MSHKVIEYINNNLSFRDEYYRIFGRSLPQKKCMCCFHPNKDTPAAAMYGNQMYCFVCRRMYSVYDLLKKYDPSSIDEIKSSILIPEEDYSKNLRSKLGIVPIDRSKTINEILTDILSGTQV